MSTAIFVIDVQQGRCEGDCAAYECEGAIGKINSVTTKVKWAWRSVIFIQHESSAGYLEHVSVDWRLAHH